MLISGLDKITGGCGRFKLLIAGLTLLLAACPRSHRASFASQSDAGSPWPLTPEGGNSSEDPPELDGKDDASSSDEDASNADEDGPPLPPGVGIGGLPNLTADIFNPAEVYLFGTLAEGACYRSAIAPVTAPNEPIAGFDCYASGIDMKIRPSDGRLLYLLRSEELYAFHVDDAAPTKQSGSLAKDSSYPKHPTDNDELIPTRPCAGNGVLRFLVSPTGELVYSCARGGWFDESEVKFFPRGNYRSFGAERTLLSSDKILRLNTMATVRIVGLPRGEPLTIRGRPDGYRLLFSIAQTSENQYGRLELWHVALDGLATREGAYPSPPANQEPQSRATLDAQGRAVQFSTGMQPPYLDTIIRRSLDGESEVIYDELEGPLLKVHISHLVTGP